MSIDRFVRRYPLACLLALVHTLLVGAYAWIELDGGWNDMNPTMLVMAALHIFDYPLHAVLQPLFAGTERTGTYLAVLLLLGGVFWFAVGAAVISITRRVAQRCATNSITLNGA